MNKFFFMILMACILGMQACNDTETVLPDYKIGCDETSLSFDFQGGEKVINLEMNTAWSVAASGWATVAPSSGEAGTASVKITVPANELKEEREMVLTFKAGGAKVDVRIVQTENSLKVEQDTVELLPTGMEQVALKLTANNDWSVKQKPEWCTLDKVEGAGGELELNVSAAENTTQENRAGFIIFSSGLVEDFVIVRQEAYRVTLEPSKVQATKDGGSYKVVLDANAAWTCTTEIPAEYGTLNVKEGKAGRTELELVLTSNKQNPRNFTLDFACGNYTTSLMIEQAAPDFVFEEVEIAGLIWCDRNLYAKSVDYENDWEATHGLYYQWGRNIGFEPGDKAVTEGPLAISEVAVNKEDAGDKNFITVTATPYNWLDEKKDDLWKNASPFSDGYRVPTNEDWLTIMPSSADKGGAIVHADQVLAVTEGVKKQKAHYFRKNQGWGNDFTHYGIKRQGKSDAYFLRWEYKNHAKDYSDKYVLTVSYWPADASATFFTDPTEKTGKTLQEIEKMYADLGEPQAVLSFPAAGKLDEDSGVLKDSWGKGRYGYYWSADVNPTEADGIYAYQFVFSNGFGLDMIADRRAIGTPVRCVKSK